MSINPNIPEEWKVRRLVAFCKNTSGELIDGDWILSKYIIPDGDIRLIQLGNIGEGEFIDNSYKWISNISFKDLKCKKLETGDILISRMADPIARSCILPNFPYKCITAVDVSIMRVDENEYSKKYANYLLNSYIVKNKAELLAAGATRKRISRKNLQSIKIPIPPLVEQRGIAEVLSNVDEAIQRTEAIIEKTEELKQGLMQRLLTQGIGHTEYKQTPLGKIPKTWKVVKTRDICEIIVPGRNKPRNFDGNIPWITISDLDDNYVYTSKEDLFISENEIKKIGNKIIPKNCVVMTCVGKFGIVAINIEKVVMNQQLHAFKCSDKIIPYFLMTALKRQKNFMQSIASTTVVPYLNKTKCLNIPIPLPPLKEQINISNILKEIDDKISYEFNKLEKLNKIKRGLMQVLLTGKVRVGLGEDGLHRIRDG